MGFAYVFTFSAFEATNVMMNIRGVVNGYLSYYIPSLQCIACRIEHN